jgi:uncharacterized membrane protein YfcA
MESLKSKLGSWFFITLIIFIGIVMVLYPHFMEGADVSGRKVLLKTILKFIWGIPAGILIILFGALLAYVEIKGVEESEEIEKQEEA